MLEHISHHKLFNCSICGYRKGHSTTTSNVFLRFRDSIIHAMKRSELTLALFADFSKAFDTVDHGNYKILEKLHNMNFSNTFLKWILSYFRGRRQYVQVNDKQSESICVNFGVPQGSILGPVLFNLYVNDLGDMYDCSTLQHADDTTLYTHCIPS